MSSINRQVRLAARPSGLPQASDWELTSETVPAPGPGQFVVAVSHLSVDPAMRGWMNAGASYIPPVEIGAVMRAGAVGHVTASQHPGLAAGDSVYGVFGVPEYAVSDGRDVLRLDTSLAPPATYLGALGMTGLTAYFALLDVGKIRAGETVVISGAAGAVGSVAGQIARLKGCRIIGMPAAPRGGGANAVGAAGDEDDRAVQLDSHPILPGFDYLSAGAGARRARSRPYSRASMTVMARLVSGDRSAITSP